MGRVIQRAYGQESQVLVTVPLLEGTDGVNKMSKSYGNYVGIDEPPEVMFGKLMSISDELMIKYYELLSDITIDQLNSLKEGIRDGTVHPRDAKVNFAKEMITRFHSKEVADGAHENFDKMFRNKEVPEDIEVVTMKKSEIGAWLPKLLATIGMVTSTSEGKRMIQQGGVNINGAKVTTDEMSFDGLSELVIKVGKRKFKKVTLE